MSERVRGTDGSAGFHKRLGFGDRPAVLVVDMCRAYFTEGSPLHLGRPEVVDACGRLVAAAREGGHPVLWSRVEYAAEGNGTVFERKVGALEVFRAGNPLGDWVAGLVPGDDDEVVTKQQASSFFDTDLAARLERLGTDTLVICGVSTSGCVRATALDACQSNLVPVVVADACGDRRQETHDTNLADLDAKYADVESLADVVAHLASHPTFRGPAGT